MKLKLDGGGRNVQHTVLEKKRSEVEWFRTGIWKLWEANESSGEAKFPLSIGE